MAPKGDPPPSPPAPSDDVVVETASAVIDALIAATALVLDYADQVIANSTAGDLEDGDV